MTPVKLSTPAPAFVKVPVVLLAMTEPITKLPAVLFWITTRSPWMSLPVVVAGPLMVPPVMVEVLAPTADVTRIPPEAIVLVPVNVSVFAAAVLKRRLLAPTESAVAPVMSSLVVAVILACAVVKAE